jgi:hypothetical protein
MILGTTRLKVEGGSPVVKKLWNDRYRLEFLCDTNSKNTDWYKDNIGGILPEFGDQQDHFFGSGVGEGWQAVPESVYDNMHCVKADYIYLPSINDKRASLIYETLTDEWVQEKDDDVQYSENGLKQVNRTFVALPDTDYTNVVGVTTTIVGGITLYLAGYKIDETDAKWTLNEIWLEAGILDATKQNDEDGILYVRFVSQGIRITPTALKPGASLDGEAEVIFQGGAAAPVYRARASDVEGFKTFETVVMLNKDGTPLEDGDTLIDITTWDNYRYPGIVDITLDDGIIPQSGGDVAVLVQITETATTSNSVGATPVPFSIKAGAYAYVNYVPEATGLNESIAKAFGTNFLSRQSIFGISTEFMGMPVRALGSSNNSDPLYNDFLIIEDPILTRGISYDKTTDEGVTWYRIKQVKLVGTFGSYLT